MISNKEQHFVLEQEFILEKNVMLAMSDGVKLSTDIYRPLEEKPGAVLLARLPYGKHRAGVLAFALDRFIQAGYTLVIQDIRGRFASEGEYTLGQNDPRDGVDTIDWITRQPWCDGTVGTFGASGLGTPQWLTAKEHPAALRTLVPMHCTHGMYTYQGGAFGLGLWLGWALRQGAAGEVERLLAQGNTSPEIMEANAEILPLLKSPPYEHLPLTDVPLLAKFAPYYFRWLTQAVAEAAERQQSPEEIYSHVTVPVLNVGGWYDMFLDGALESYLQMKQHGGSQQAREGQHLLIGPWAHFDLPGIFPQRNYGPQASTQGSDLVGIHLRWYDHWLRGIENGVAQEKPVRIFVMGADVWRDEEDWPLPDTQYTRYYLHSQGKAQSVTGDGSLSLEPASEEKEDFYIYDPRNPVPTVGGANLLGFNDEVRSQLVKDNPGAYMFNAGPLDQRQVEQRDDVLCYTTQPLEQPLEVTGSLELVLAVSSSAVDTDFTGKLVDVYPDGRAEILLDGILRARYREAIESPVLMEPGQIYELHISLGAISNVFKVGHRVRLEVASSNFPRFDRNTNTGGDIITERDEDLIVATNRVYHDSEHPSYLILPLIERASE